MKRGAKQLFCKSIYSSPLHFKNGLIVLPRSQLLNISADPCTLNISTRVQFTLMNCCDTGNMFRYFAVMIRRIWVKSNERHSTIGAILIGNK